MMNCCALRVAGVKLLTVQAGERRETMKTLKQFIGCQRSVAANTSRWNAARLAADCTLLLVWLGILPVALAQPANDNFANRIAISGTSASVTGTNTGATKEPGEPNHAGYSGGASVWWSWVAPAATTVSLDTIGSGFDTVLAVYTGTVISNLTHVASASQTINVNGHYASRVGFVSTSGVAYSIAVDDEFGSTGSIVLNLRTGVPVITTQPQTQGVTAGSNATFSVVAVGDPPIFYQWTKGGKNIPNATSAVLTLTNLQITNAGTYAVVVTNSVGSASSSSVTLSLPVTEPYLFTTIAEGFNNPDAVALDSAGNLYVAEFDNHTIRKVAPVGTNWVVTTVAGAAGSSGFVDGTNSDARFYRPNGVALDGAGNLYVTDSGNRAVRKVSPQGTNWVVSTIMAGIANCAGPASLGGCALDTAGNIYIADIWCHIIQRISLVGTNWVIKPVAGLAGSSGSSDGTNSAARFNFPDRVAVDAAGNLYVGDFQNDTIRKITRDGTNWVVHTIAGRVGQYGAVDGTNGTSQLSSPEGVAVDSAGNVYVGDKGDSTIRKITPTGVTTTLAGLAGAWGDSDGMGDAARFLTVNGVAVDSHGTVYVADYAAIRMGKPAIQMQPLPSAASGQSQTQGFGFSMTLASGLNYRIQASSSLNAWADLTNFTPAGLTYSFWDSGATNLPQRFYRVLGP